MINNKIQTIKLTTLKLLIDKTMVNWRDKIPRSEKPLGKCRINYENLIKNVVK